MPSFLSDEATAALTGAIKAIEARSSAEVVITVKARSGRYGHVGLCCGALAAFAALAFLLYSPWGFSSWSILLDPLIVGLLVGLTCRKSVALARLLTPAGARAERALQAARATFFQKGMRHTSGRTGVLVHVSLLERRVSVLPDSGVTSTVPGEAWDEAVAAIEQAVAAGQDGVAVAEKILALGNVLEPALPRAEDDVNELPDEVDQ